MRKPTDDIPIEDKNTKKGSITKATPHPDCKTNDKTISSQTKLRKIWLLGSFPEATHLYNRLQYGTDLSLPEAYSTAHTKIIKNFLVCAYMFVNHVRFQCGSTSDGHVYSM